jgi:hypothetical protein
MPGARQVSLEESDLADNDKVSAGISEIARPQADHEKIEASVDNGASDDHDGSNVQNQAWGRHGKFFMWMGYVEALEEICLLTCNQHRFDVDSFVSELPLHALQC